MPPLGATPHVKCLVELQSPRFDHVPSPCAALTNPAMTLDLQEVYDFAIELSMKAGAAISQGSAMRFKNAGTSIVFTFNRSWLR